MIVKRKKVCVLYVNIWLEMSLKGRCQNILLRSQLFLQKADVSSFLTDYHNNNLLSSVLQPFVSFNLVEGEQRYIAICSQ